MNCGRTTDGIEPPRRQENERMEPQIRKISHKEAHNAQEGTDGKNKPQMTQMGADKKD